MNLLALDTSSKAASCALLRDGILWAESFVNAGLTHSQTLMPMVEDMLKNAGTPLKEIDAFAVSAGPGSFTGLRIGIAAVKGMALALDKPCAGVSTLLALAGNLLAWDGIIAPVMDARRDQVYTALFRCEKGRLTRLEADAALSLEDLAKRLAPLTPAPIILVGDGAALCMDKLGLSHLRLCPEALRHQRASSVAWAALEEHHFLPAQDLVPAYLRMPQAQRELLERQAKGQP